MKERIKQLREYLGLSQAEFAKKINKTPGFISLIETGRSGLSAGTIVLICQTFGVNPDWLKTGEGSMFQEGKETPAADKDGIGDRVRQVRIKRGMSTKEFAELLHYTKGQIYNVENGRTIPSDEFLQKISTNFLVSYQWLVTGVKSKEEASEETIDKQIQIITEYLKEDSVAREVVLEAMKQDRGIWLIIDRLIRGK